MRILILNGPNLNLLGLREPDIYGKRGYAELCEMISEKCRREEIEVSFFQSNHEGALVDEIQKAYFDKVDGIVFNPAAYTHTSVALLDALKATKIPCVEVHISDPDNRDSFRKISYVREACIKTVSGKGFDSYTEALSILKEHLENK